ncbi:MULTISPECIES: 4a-hydroxytetrahydrobiopterin dehydratase [Prochlorococcus]|uniref:4a-hydroxytetrahydrobiopterin dehydratase n=1 Tax=Prochlorococcus marinus (strain SARG / CCMP1375 / SS120) TaxID=167539 RepID=Q7VD26_PROMA|nr:MULTISPECIES: 4a-hydroxytetrahydrobiopterin dehydratase [Prochlorococcus]AAP99603.1 Possible pterin-4 alpha-carbinolamine dehydratase-like protein [Prochlorococcus marinus subsp. marinus str. CCMP1375]KGG11127.1 putative pterin-4 alpha-carbinolamine dehydratase-like protein [Prochlorococcus marinus str. LG]KGG21465.1 putative pterin-4 alpha-carbinolamine dehydratase-like protein [Prochlorococcus marinus str. SS2]KGG23190.1 putative pterin-4 alpha-carbinolamine dehydratase-like protein [Proch
MHKWQERSRPLRLERRFEFATYELTRDFLDCLGKLCEKRQRFPDISFGKTYVNLTLQIDSEDEDSQASDLDKEFAMEIDALIDEDSD